MKKITVLCMSVFLFVGYGTTMAQLISKKKTQTEIPDIPEFVEVEGGTFKMGSNTRDREKPIHDVMLSSFQISKYPITVKQYKKFCDATGRSMPEAPDWGWQTIIL